MRSDKRDSPNSSHRPCLLHYHCKQKTKSCSDIIARVKRPEGASCTLQRIFSIRLRRKSPSANTCSSFSCTLFISLTPSLSFLAFITLNQVDVQQTTWRCINTTLVLQGKNEHDLQTWQVESSQPLYSSSLTQGDSQLSIEDYYLEHAKIEHSNKILWT